MAIRSPFLPCNPVLPGFHPDPSLCVVGDTFYIATSTFEWYPGVSIHSSKDLQRWTLAARPLDCARFLDLRGNPDSCGVWAPCLSHSDGRFWLVYTDVKRYDGNYKDTHNYVTTAPSITGPWSDRVYVNSSGFDPSLFHDPVSGKKYFINMDWDAHGDSAAPARFFAGILLQEFDAHKMELVDEARCVFRGSERGFTEGPHIAYARGYYYLVTAEGGTGYDHAVTHARSRSIEGPYEVHPDVHVITAESADAVLQRCGHGQFVEGADGRVWHSFLCSRPRDGMRKGTMRSVCGRETAVVECVWGEDDWLYVKNRGCGFGGKAVTVDSEVSTVAKFEGGSKLGVDFMWLRTPETERIFEIRETGGLRLFGRESIGSWFEQALVARRVTEWFWSAETVLDFDPRDIDTMAGLAIYYGRHQFYYLYVNRDGAGKRRIAVQGCGGDWPEARLIRPAGSGDLIPSGKVRLGVSSATDGQLQFRYAVESEADKNSSTWIDIGGSLDGTELSDEGGRGEHANFTGCFAGMACQDLGGYGHVADFDEFSYSTRGGASSNI